MEAQSLGGNPDGQHLWWCISRLIYSNNAGYVLKPAVYVQWCILSCLPACFTTVVFWLRTSQSWEEIKDILLLKLVSCYQLNHPAHVQPATSCCFSQLQPPQDHRCGVCAKWDIHLTSCVDKTFSKSFTVRRRLMTQWPGNTSAGEHHMGDKAGAPAEHTALSHPLCAPQKPVVLKATSSCSVNGTELLTVWEHWPETGMSSPSVSFMPQTPRAAGANMTHSRSLAARAGNNKQINVLHTC